MEQRYQHFNLKERTLTIGGEKRISVSAKWPDGYGIVIPALVANCDAHLWCGRHYYPRGTQLLANDCLQT